ncbi:hypothetical protein D8674_011588 [Pyrus ussuriensis x Pyrus communis]|uniref:Uncharacterized protein n=1 Tax=Pyrus ussuriensis x Pyrus communis TaxID=2448454 RepID=A0A5N5G400_9ROSA|nr:hypothetical protein D8674_011588 [Pyrus ussuriensis x Pyrus communis]
MSQNCLVFEKIIVEPMESIMLLKKQCVSLRNWNEGTMCRWGVAVGDHPVYETIIEVSRIYSHSSCLQQGNASCGANGVHNATEETMLNVDGDWFKVLGRGGYGWVARDYAGIFQGSVEFILTPRVCNKATYHVEPMESIMLLKKQCVSLRNWNEGTMCRWGAAAGDCPGVGSWWIWMGDIRASKYLKRK